MNVLYYFTCCSCNSMTIGFAYGYHGSLLSGRGLSTQWLDLDPPKITKNTSIAIHTLLAVTEWNWPKMISANLIEIGFERCFFFCFRRHCFVCVVGAHGAGTAGGLPFCHISTQRTKSQRI